MSAVMVEETTEAIPTLHWREVNSLLEYWGRARWRVGLAGGFPEQSATVGRVELYEPRDWFQVAQLTAQGKQNPYFGGHRILSECCWHVSPTLLAVNRAVNLLPEPQFQAVAVSYAMGAVYAREFAEKEKAEVLGTTVDAMNERLRRARKALGRMLVNYRHEAQLRAVVRLSEH